jgi:uncharacterized protein
MLSIKGTQRFGQADKFREKRMSHCRLRERCAWARGFYTEAMNTPILRQLFALCALLIALLPVFARAQSLPDPVQFSRVIEIGDVRQARVWLESGLPPNFEGTVIGSGLMIGAWTGNVPMMALFKEFGADVNKANSLGEQALLHAAWRGHASAVEWLLANGAKVNRTGKEWAALHYAAFAGHAEVVKLLLGRGAQVNALSTNGSTPLMMAAREGRESIAVDLLQAGADPSVSNEWGDDAYTWAMRQRNTNIARLVAGSDPSLRKPVPISPSRRSQPINEMADRLLNRARDLDAQGKRAEALKTYRAAMVAIKRAERDQEIAQAKPSSGQVSGLRITAKRDNPQTQSAQIAYSRPATTAIDAAPGSAPNSAQVGAGETAISRSQRNEETAISRSRRNEETAISGARNAPAKSASEPQDPVERMMMQARELEAKGKRAEAMTLYRQAASLLRQ